MYAVKLLSPHSSRHSAISEGLYMCYHLSISKQNIVTHRGPKSQLGPPHTVTFDGNYWCILISKYSSPLIFAIVLAILTVANVTTLL